MRNTIDIISFEEKITVQRILGQIKGIKQSPTVIAIAGIHGNERAGVNALLKVFKTIKEDALQLKGNFYGIAGNMNAISNNIRFKNVDLNRIWTKEQLLNTYLGEDLKGESKEQKEIYDIIKNILETEVGPFYFLDLHTTSADTQPFITISDSLNNRSYSSNFNIPTILGIEEFLDGPLLTYINEFGHVALGFEAGQHNKKVSVDNAISFLWLALVSAKCISKKYVGKYSFYKKSLSVFKERQEFYEINYKYSIKPFEDFKMVSGYKNFQQIENNELLAFSNGNEVFAKSAGKIFMPLYQQKGDDGFFIITKISSFWLYLSRILRKLSFHNFLRLLPGISTDKKKPHTIIVNPKTVKFLATDIFHLFGYRKKVLKKNKIHFIKRDRKVTSFL